MGGVQAGAGGADAQDWADTLLRMYTRWAEKQGFAASLLSRAEGTQTALTLSLHQQVQALLS